MKNGPSTALVLFALSSATLAQDPPLRASQRSTFFQGGSSYADVWGEGSLALVAGRGQNRMDVVDVSDPDNATFLASYFVPSPNQLASAQDVKSANGLAFLALDGNSQDSAQIVDVRTPSSPTLLTTISITGASSIHNLFYDSGWLYLARGSGDGIWLVDLRSYDPNNPPATITSAARTITGAGSVHDITAANGRLWVSDISGSQRVFDITDPATQEPFLLGQVEGGVVHSNWPSADGAFLVVVDESFGGPAKLYEVIDSGSSISFVQRDSWVNTLIGFGTSGNPHNPLIDGDRIYLANNAGGVLCLQVDRSSWTMERVASFDTSTINPAGPAGEGCWGVYPYLGADRILASDRQTGLYVLDFSALEIAFPAPRPVLLDPAADATLDVTIGVLGAVALDPTTVTLNTSVDGAAFQETPMTSTGGNGWSGTLPVVPCGSRLDWYVSCEDTGGQEYTRPGDAPTEVYTAFGASSPTTVLADDFELDLGWTASFIGDNTAGRWERGVPVDNGFQPPHDDPNGTGTQCYVTEIGSGGPDDVDGGQVRLTSPVMDFSAGDGVIQYRRWHYQDDANGIQSEPFLVQVSNDAGANWTTVESTVLNAGGWIHHAFRISDHVPPTAQVQVRFAASDQPNNTTVEAGVDSFLAQLFACPVAAAVQRNGSGLNALCYTSLTPPALGTTWLAQVDHSGHPGASFTAIVLYSGAATGPVISFGELLVNLGSPKLFQSLMASSGTEDVHANPIPLDPTFAGAFSATQAAILGGSGPELCNAVDLTVGY